MVARAAAVIRVEAVWLAVEPLDLRIGMESALARVVGVFGAAQPHHAYLFTNRRVNRIKVLVHDGFGLWLVVRRLHQGRFLWAASGSRRIELTREQFDALVLGLPWQRLGAAGAINLV
jgi:transposase